MHKVKTTVAQIPEQENLSKIKTIIQKKKDSDLIIFPESILLIDSLEPINMIQNIVTKYSTAVIIGIIHQKGKRLYNYAYYISPKKVERYQKVHVHWTEKFVPGKKFKVVKTPFGKIGLLICYDASFQESGRILALMGAEIIVGIYAIPSHFPYKINLIRSQSMAVNNQVYVINSCKLGEKYVGHGAIFDPYGKNLIELSRGLSIITKTIDLEVIKKWREKEKIFTHRKPKLYSIIASNNHST